MDQDIVDAFTRTKAAVLPNPDPNAPPKDNLKQYGTKNAQEQIEQLINAVISKGQAATTAAEENVGVQKQAQQDLGTQTDAVVAAIARTGEAAKEANKANNDQVQQLDKRITTMVQSSGFNQLDQNFEDIRNGLTVNLQKIEDKVLAPPTPGIVGKIVDYFTRPSREQWNQAQADIVAQAQTEQQVANSVSAKANAIKVTQPLAKSEQVLAAEAKQFEAQTEVESGKFKAQSVLQKAEMASQTTRSIIQTAEQASSYLNSVVNAYLAHDTLKMNELQLMNLQYTVAEKKMTYEAMQRERSSQVAMQQRFGLSDNEMQGVLRSPELLATYTDRWIGSYVAPDPQDIRGNQASAAGAARSANTVSARTLGPTFYTGRDDKFNRAKEIDVEITRAEKEAAAIKKLSASVGGTMSTEQKKELIALESEAQSLRAQRNALYPASGDVNDEFTSTYISYNGKNQSYIDHISDAVFTDPNSPLGRQIYLNSPYTKQLLDTNRPGTKLLRKVQEDILANDKNIQTGIRPDQHLDLYYLRDIAGGTPAEIWDFMQMGKEITTYESDYKFMGLQTPPNIRVPVRYTTVDNGTKKITVNDAKIDNFQDLNNLLVQSDVAKKFAIDQAKTRTTEQQLLQTQFAVPPANRRFEP